jgi:hypothetical protein
MVRPALAARAFAFVLTLAAVSQIDASAHTVAAQSRPVAAVYEASVAGVRIGEATLSGQFDPRGAFDVAMQAKYRLLMWKGNLSSTAQGRMEAGRVAAANYSIVTKAKDERMASIALDKGNVVALQMDPPAKVEGRVPIEAEHKRGVLDPLSGMIWGALQAANAPGGPCGGALPVFTGWNRFDLRFAPATATASSSSGAALAAGAGSHVCEVTFVPISGHKKKDSVIGQIAASREMRVVFPSPDASGLRLPSEIIMPLWIGSLHIKRKS